MLNMKKQILLLLTFALALGGQAVAQTAKTYKNASAGNPISPCIFCADPTALVYDGRLYVYGPNDHQQYVANGKTGENSYGAIKSLVVFSTDDMVNWTFNGTIDVAKLCSSWGWRFADSWAPSATWRLNADGQPEFFLYFANGGGSVGVLRAASPVGPFRSPLSQPMIDGNTPGVKPCNWVFDPGVVIDDDGTGWIAFGGGDPNSQGTKLMPGNARIARLNSSMTGLDGAAVALPAPYMFEANELNMMDGRFVYTFNTSWSDRNDWSSYAGRGSFAAPSSCSMCYMVSSTPLDPASWQYRGEYVANPGSFGFGYGNNHTHLQKFGDKYYLFYHSSMLLQAMNTSDASGFRSLCVDEVTVKESTPSIGKLTMTRAGVAAIKNLNPYEQQQMETMSTSGGVNYEDFYNTASATTVSSLHNDASKNLQVKMAAGAWTMLRKVDFGSRGAQAFTLRAKGTGTLEVRLNTISAKPVAVVEVSSSTLQEHTVSLDPTAFTGVRNLFLVCTASENMLVDEWRFTEYDASAVGSVPADAQPTAVYDLSGQRVVNGSGVRGGLVIEKVVDGSGRNAVGRKVIVR